MKLISLCGSRSITFFEVLFCAVQVTFRLTTVVLLAGSAPFEASPPAGIVHGVLNGSGAVFCFTSAPLELATYTFQPVAPQIAGGAAGAETTKTLLALTARLTSAEANVSPLAFTIVVCAK